MQNIKGKRLLFLGGSMLDAHAIRIAQSLGVHAIVANYYSFEKSPAKSFADESYQIDNTDIAIMKQRMKEWKIDGIFGGYTDSNLPTYCELCSIGDFPCYGTKDQFDITIDKLKFKKMCHEAGVNTVEEYSYSDITPISYDKFPLYIKPADSSGSRGCSMARDYNEYLVAIDAAMKYSMEKKVIVERYYDFHKYGDFMACYSLRDGEITLATLADRVLYQGNGNISPLPAQLTYPSKYLNVYRRTTDNLVKNMLRRNGFKNGTLFLQGFTDGNEFRFFEMGYRQNGSQQFVLTDYFNHNNTLIEAIYFALTGIVDKNASPRDDAAFPYPACNMVIYLKQGRVSKIQGISEVLNMPQVINYTPWLLEGDTVGVEGTLGQSFGRFHVIGKDAEDLKQHIQKIRDTIKVFDAYGNSMIIDL